GDDDGTARILGVGNGLFGLRHHAVVGGHHQDHDVRALGTARAHLRERFVTRRIEEGDATAVRLHRVGTDVLGDAASFACGHLGTADLVEQARFAVVDVTHDRHDGCAGLAFGIVSVGLTALCRGDGFVFTDCNVFDVPTE